MQEGGAPQWTLSRSDTCDGWWDARGGARRNGRYPPLAVGRMNMKSNVVSPGPITT